MHRELLRSSLDLHAGAEAERSRGKSEIGIHLQRRKTDVHPVEPRHDVEDEQERDQPQCNFAQSYRRNIWQLRSS